MNQPSTSTMGISQCDIPSTSTMVISQCNKPSTSAVPTGNVSTSLKRKRLKSESPVSSEVDSESVYSYQGYETELVMDTPDTDTKSEYDDSDEDIEIEYDVRSSSENDDVPIGNDSTSGADDFLAVAGAISAVICEPSLEPSLTDSEDSDGSSVTEVNVNRTDYNMCIQCKLKNDNPLFRYCKKCFQLRKTFFPPRPKGFKKKVRKSNERTLPKHTKLSLPHLIKEDKISSITSTSPTVNEKASDLEEKEKSKGSLLQSTLSEYKELCIMCNTQSKNSIFIHGSTAHMCCCYKCSMKSWKLNKKCPACNRKANNVVKVFVI